jgi:hypothetical protein
MITPADIGGEEDLARRILVRARSIAPCIDSLVDGPGEDDPQPRSDAIAILKGVLAELPTPGSRRTRSMSRNGTSVSYSDLVSAFDVDATVSLRSLCASTSRPGLPAGSFPKGGAVRRLWPEEYE